MVTQYAGLEDLTHRGPETVRCACGVPGCTRTRPERRALCAYHWRRLTVPTRRLLMRYHTAPVALRTALADVAVSALQLAQRQRVPAHVLRGTLAALPPMVARDARAALSQLLPAD